MLYSDHHSRPGASFPASQSEGEDTPDPVWFSHSSLLGTFKGHGRTGAHEDTDTSTFVLLFPRSIWVAAIFIVCLMDK